MYENKCCPCPEECPPPPPPEPKECSNSGQSAIPVSWAKPLNPDGTDPNCPDAVPCTPDCTIDPATVPVGISPLKPIAAANECAGCWPETEEIPTTMQGITRTIVMGVDPCAKCEENGEEETNPAPPPEPPPDQQIAKLTIDVTHSFVVVSPSPVRVGDTGTVTVTVTNTGDANYTGANPTINIPSGFTVTSQSVSGNLNAGQTKTWTFQVTANAAGSWTTTASVSGKSDSATTSVQAVDTSEPEEDPGIFPADAQAEATVGSPANEIDYGTTGLRGAVRFSISPALPSGMSLNTSTGVISGTPTAVQSQRTYTVSATDGLTTLTAIYRLTVNAVQTVSIAPASQEITGAKVGVAITPTQAYTATGFTGPVTYTWTLSPTSGLTINSSTGVVSGTPNPNMELGAFTTTVTATSGSQSATATILIRQVQPA